MSFKSNIQFLNYDVKKITCWEGPICVFVSNPKFKDKYLNELDVNIAGAIRNSVHCPEFEDLNEGQGLTLLYPPGIKASAVHIIKYDYSSDLILAREVGAAVTEFECDKPVLFLFAEKKQICEIMYGYFLKLYSFDYYKKKGSNKINKSSNALVMVSDPEGYISKFESFRAVLEGVYLSRDLINEPANILTTEEFAKRIKNLTKVGLKVEILDEAELYDLGMHALLAVGRGSASPSKVAIIRWKTNKKRKKTLLLVGKGVVFDTGGISLKSSNGMEEMTMDMGGAGVVVGVMKTIALRKSPSSVVGIVGLVENMPDGNAQRPGDIVKSLKGDTIEVVNTDAEGRLVLCDLLWYAQTRFNPHAIIDFATLTGAIIVALGNQNAGVFSNNDQLCKEFLKITDLEGEGAWRMPLSPRYAKLLKSRTADLANVGGRGAGACTAAEFLHRFIRKGTKWIHVDIAGVAVSKSAGRLAPAGATGWGVASVNRFIREFYEK